MSESAPAVVSCPHCGKPVPWTDASEHKPFCSERCKLVDLGDWLLEKHVIPGEDAMLPEADEDDSR